ncbi:hypothetical protein [Spirillospora sp. NPDC047279]|uniref:hypothetical protein n=1 Tax=Spirillospora sp. NPDC047279 TaxID=3155478 RepID=UPI0033DF6C92
MQRIAPRLTRGAAVLAGAGLCTAMFGIGPALAAGPATEVTPATEANPDGQDLRVVGSGFDPDKNNGFGVYVAFGPKTPDHTTNANVFQQAKWVHKNASSSPGQARMNTDGTFDLTLAGIKAKYTDGDGKAWDCLTTQCYIITIAAHGSPDRSQDTYTPVRFVGGGDPGDPGDPGGGSGDQTITAKVKRGGALTLSLAGSSVALPEVGAGERTSGQLNTATVTDSRGTNAGWNLVGQATDLTSTEGGTVPASNLGWTPAAGPAKDGSTGVATPGPQVTGLDQARTLAGSAAGNSGGVFDLGAGLDLLIPAGATAGDYTGTLTLTLS